MSKVSDYSESSMKSWSISEIETRYKPNEGSSYKGNVGAGWVLKDRTESTNNGITEIRFWFGPSNNWHFVNFIPFFGQATSVIIASINESLPWRSAYFDHDTGIFLSNDLDSARRKQYDIRIGEAEGLLEKGEFIAAHNKFAQAWRDSNDSSIKDKLKNCLDSTTLPAEAQTLFNSGKFSEAVVKFEQAHNGASVTTVKNKLKNCLDSTKFAAEGQSLFDSGEFSEAAANFQLAYLLSNVREIYTKFSNYRAVANIAAKAQTLLNCRM
ncbi:MAG: hypothetical protein LN545_03585 [Candidatus Megaira endosymbiont of Carteria cerasiformis]|nr:hypothetical protein [Candidatus Megaera polyxenophila]MCC8461055.1 hypothetical protein [Candidatus Megaera polyxenophila]